MRRFAFAAIIALSGAPATAQGVPTVDTQNIAQEIRQLQQMLEDFGIQTDQLDALLDQLGIVQEQLDRLYELEAAMTGPSGIVGMVMDGGLDGLLDQEFSGLLDTIRAIQQGDWSTLVGDAAPKVRTQMERVLAEHGFDEDTLRDMATSGEPAAVRTATQASSGAMISAAAQNSHEEAAQSLERVDRLVGMIGEMETLKESLDHNTRVTAELAIALVAMWELEAIQTVGMGQAGVVDAATLAEERRFMDFTLPELAR